MIPYENVSVALQVGSKFVEREVGRDNVAAIFIVDGDAFKGEVVNVVFEDGHTDIYPIASLLRLTQKMAII